jgi:predicted exporter
MIVLGGQGVTPPAKPSLFLGSIAAKCAEKRSLATKGTPSLRKIIISIQIVVRSLGSLLSGLTPMVIGLVCNMAS